MAAGIIETTRTITGTDRMDIDAGRHVKWNDADLVYVGVHDMEHRFIRPYGGNQELISMYSARKLDFDPETKAILFFEVDYTLTILGKDDPEFSHMKTLLNSRRIHQ